MENFNEKALQRSRDSEADLKSEIEESKKEMGKIILEKFNKKAGLNIPAESFDDLKEKMQEKLDNELEEI